MRNPSFATDLSELNWSVQEVIGEFSGLSEPRIGSLTVADPLKVAEPSERVRDAEGRPISLALGKRRI